MRFKRKMLNNQPIVRHFFDLVEQKKVTAKVLAGKTGVSPNSIGLWRYRTMPRIDTFEAALNVIGYTLKIEKLEK